MAYFREDNTEGYTAADLVTLNDWFEAACKAQKIDPATAEKSHIDRIGELVLAAYDTRKAKDQ